VVFQCPGKSEIGKEEEETSLTEAMHPIQAIQTIQTALGSLEDGIDSIRLWKRDYGKDGKGSMGAAYSDEHMLNEIVREAEKMMRSAKKIHDQAVKAVAAHKALDK